jgi:tRNA A22 N-methylase
MEQKEIKITIPEGYEIDKQKSTFEKIVFKKKDNKYPKTWKECIEKLNTKEHNFAYIDAFSNIKLINAMDKIEN